VTIFDAAGTAAGVVRSGRSPFAAEVRLRRTDAARMAKVVSLVAGRIASDEIAPCCQLHRLEELARSTLGRFDPTVAGETTFGLNEALDLAAGLVESADTLAECGLPVQAFALEGVAGRLLEALLDAGALAAGTCGDANR
jgi:hypothetical protein